MRRLVLLALAAAVVPGAACTDIDTSDLEPIDDYESWRLWGELEGETAGHPGTFRRIFVNDVARGYGGTGKYPARSVIVKEIWSERGGSLEYVAVMRKERDDDGGWVFTQIKDGDERYLDLCWSSCHRQAPFDGAWFSYGDP
jgi:hypothetical protein